MIYHTGFLQKFFFCTHSGPLEGCERLRNKEGRAGHHLNLSISLILWNFIIRLGNPLRQQRDSFHILHSLCWKTQHKIKLDPVPSAPECLCGAGQNFLLCQPLVDHIPETLGTGLRRKSQAALFHILDLAHHIQGKRINPQRRQGHVDAFAMELFN